MKTIKGDEVKFLKLIERHKLKDFIVNVISSQLVQVWMFKNQAQGEIDHIANYHGPIISISLPIFKSTGCASQCLTQSYLHCMALDDLIYEIENRNQIWTVKLQAGALAEPEVEKLKREILKLESALLELNKRVENLT